MGGNVKINGIASVPFTLEERDHVVPLIRSLLIELNIICDYRLFAGCLRSALNKCTAYSGSSRMYMDPKVKESDIQAKPTYGDIDVIVAKESQSILAEVLAEGAIIDSVWRVIGYKQIASSFSCLIEDPQGTVRQIDFEFKDYDPETHEPTKFAQWSQSVTLVDLQAGIKGTFHKHLISACLEADVYMGIVETNKRGILSYAPGMVRRHTFAQTHGIRYKHIAGSIRGSWKLAPVPYTYTTNMQDIADLILPDLVPYNDHNMTHIASFISLATAIPDYYDAEQVENIIKAFIRRLFDHKAMSPIDMNRSNDQSIKLVALDHLFRLSNTQNAGYYAALIAESSSYYYSKWKHDDPD